MVLLKTDVWSTQIRWVCQICHAPSDFTGRYVGRSKFCQWRVFTTAFEKANWTTADAETPAKMQAMYVVEVVPHIFQIGDLQVRTWFGVVEHLAVYAVLGTTFIDRYIRNIFPMEKSCSLAPMFNGSTFNSTSPAIKCKYIVGNTAIQGMNDHFSYLRREVHNDSGWSGRLCNAEEVRDWTYDYLKANESEEHEPTVAWSVQEDVQLHHPFLLLVTYFSQNQ